MIFRPYAEDLAGRVAAHSPAQVLEVACGTGVVTRCLAKLLPQDCSIVATDLNQAMIDQAKRFTSQSNVIWQQADVMSLPFSNECFDTVVCQFSVMFFPDRVRAYQEIKRVLRPGGSFVFNVWNEIESNDFAHVVTEALRLRYPDDPPRFLARTPHGHGSVEEIESDLRAAGYREIEFTQRDDISPASSHDVPAIAYCQGTPLREEILERDPEGLAAATSEAAEAIRARFGEGSIEGRISGVVVVAR